MPCEQSWCDPPNCSRNHAPSNCRSTGVGAGSRNGSSNSRHRCQTTRKNRATDRLSHTCVAMVIVCRDVLRHRGSVTNDFCDRERELCNPISIAGYTFYHHRGTLTLISLNLSTPLTFESDRTAITPWYTLMVNCSNRGRYLYTCSWCWYNRRRFCSSVAKEQNQRLA